ncbi:MAG TPA: alcohol dehydrogenase [Gammaproteobacteria bacterium]|nr:alcohol dehydrogenase [Gammaproteobacteria bacterium]HIK70505.1 alcohol dehydrogenase [Pseudomonadales bacterium]
MRGIWLEKGTMSYQDSLPMPVLGSDELLVKVRYAGICGTDIELQQGYYRFKGIPGHEFVGEISTGPRRGQRVVADINIGCGNCLHCRQDLHRHCLDRKVIGIKNRPGAFAEFLAVPENNLLTIPDSLPDSLAVLTEPTAAAFEILEQLADQIPERVLVVGAGRLGMLVAHVLSSAGSEVTLLMRNQQRLQHIQDSSISVKADTGEMHYSLAVDCTGSPAGFAAALASLEPRGTLVLKSTFPELSQFDLGAIMVNEIRLLGSRCGPMQRAIDWLSGGYFELPRITSLGFDACEQAFQLVDDPTVYKVLLHP